MTVDAIDCDGDGDGDGEEVQEEMVLVVEFDAGWLTLREG